MEITRPQDTYFDDVANYIITIVSLTLTLELYASGTASPYATNHMFKLDAKQAGKRLTFYPYPLLNEVIALKWPAKLRIEEEDIEKPPQDAILDLGPLARPLYALEQSMFVNYFERQKPSVDVKYGTGAFSWPGTWNFARVVRNSVAHANAVYFTNPNASSVSWRGLTYAPADNGRKVLNGDLWAADLIYLMMDMDRLLR